MIMDYRLATYFIHAEGALEEDRVPERYLTNTCPECGDAVTTYTEATEGPHVVTRVSNTDNDAGYYILVGCEGYRLINPESIGLPLGNWQDWTKSDEAALGTEVTGVHDAACAGGSACVCGPEWDRPATMD